MQSVQNSDQNDPQLQALLQELKSIRTMEHEEQMDYKGVIQWLELAQKFYDKQKDFPTEMICRFLFEFVKVFKQMGSALGMAFSDVKEKVATLRELTNKYNEPMFFKVVELEIKNNLHQLNGDNNKKLKASPEHKNYKSSARQMLRMMRFMDFLYIMFTGIVEDKQKSISDCLKLAYKNALEEHHAWAVKVAAKAAMGFSPNRQEFVYLIVEKDKTHEFSYDVMSKMTKQILQVKTGLWEYYNQNGLSALP